ncbi:protein shisa-5-like isoform X2 [Diachasmimorpha longicaudata]|uniref:protein shisa-5-like isoform X2 n=1 Tax=Diachasmimorpha longicaudata TaxID=58733 RepID=UPI0030B8A650
MSRVVLIVLIALGATAVQGMDCNFGTSSNIFEKVLSHCPGILDSSDKEFCCIGTDRFYCCDAKEFALQTGWIVIPVVIGVAVVVSIIIFCISCLCCSCCPWYRRRHRGTVYGIPTPTVVTVVQPSNAPIAQHQLYPSLSTAPSLPAQPPPYTQEAYTKQAPYNPSY